jgi:uncharacterized protein YxjI
MLDKNKFVVKAETKGLIAKRTFEILDGDGGQVLGLATEKAGFLATVLGMAMGKDNMSMTVEVRQKPDNALVFIVRRSGLLFKKVQVLNGQGQVVGSYKAKKFSLSGGFHVYDKDGKHFADIKGKIFKAEYKFMTPDGATEMGSVSRTWGGLAKALFTGGGTYGVQIEPRYAQDPTAKMLILGAAIAVDTMFKKQVEKSGGGTVTSGGDE